MQDSQQIYDNAYRNFIHSLRSPKTRLDYEKSLSYFMAWKKMDSYRALLERAPRLIESDIIDYIIYLKEQKKVSPSTVDSYIAAIHHFYYMNDVELK